MTGQQRLVPTIKMVKMHYMREHKSKDLFVAAIVDWVNEPNTDESIIPGALNWFKLMEPVAISEEDVRLIAEYLYETDLPGYGGHKKKHMRLGGGN